MTPGRFGLRISLRGRLCLASPSAPVPLGVKATRETIDAKAEALGPIKIIGKHDRDSSYPHGGKDDSAARVVKAHAISGPR
jgi:hypothetical protein